MSIFALVTDLEIINPPSWYAAFTEKYLSRPKPHITLIQPRYIDADEGKQLLETLKSDLQQFSTMFPITDRAKGIMPFQDETGFMISVNNKQVIEFQKELRERIPKDLEFVNSKGKEYEQHFEPHLTMADMIPVGLLPGVLEEFDVENLVLDVQVNCILCILPPDFSVEESAKEVNYHIMLP